MAKQRINSDQNGGFWQELGRATATGAVSSLSIPSFTSKKYLRFVINTHTGGSTLTAFLRFNNDSGTNYQYKTNENGTESGGTGQTGVQLGSNALVGFFGEFDVVNESGYHKPGASTHWLYWDNSNLYRNTYSAKWSGTSLITRADMVATAGNFQAGSEIIVLGHD